MKRRNRTQQGSCGNEDRGEAPWRKTEMVVERPCGKGPESLKDLGGMGY